MSTIIGGCWAEGGEIATGMEDALDSRSMGNGGGGGTTYIVIAGEDGAVRFYDLKFRVEVSDI